MADAKFTQLNENKIDKSLRNSAALQKTFNRACKGEFDVDIDSATGMNLLKVTEIFTFHRQFNLDLGGYVYTCFKSVIYMENPGKYYFDTVKDTVYRRVKKQHEIYAFYEQIENTVNRYHCDIIDDDNGKKLTLKDVEKDLPSQKTNQA